jgi:hypothetical protein
MLVLSQVVDTQSRLEEGEVGTGAWKKGFPAFIVQFEARLDGKGGGGGHLCSFSNIHSCYSTWLICPVAIFQSWSVYLLIP